jgi:hypothetical protein
MLASFSLLAKYSSFFATLKDLPRPDEADEPVIPLPSATSAGLALVISVLEDCDRAESAKAAQREAASLAAADAQKSAATNMPLNEVDWTTVSETDLEHVNAAITVADAYGIPVFTTHYLDKVHKAIAADPCLAFTMAALAKDEYKARISSGDLLGSTRSLSVGMKTLLEQHAPEYLVGLARHQAAYTFARYKLLGALKYGTPMANGFNDYGKMCKRRFHGCEAYDQHHSFKKMRIAYANQEYEKLIRIGLSNDHWYHVDVGCQKCSTRVSRCFRWAMADFAVVKNAFAF